MILQLSDYGNIIRVFFARQNGRKTGNKKHHVLNGGYSSHASVFLSRMIPSVTQGHADPDEAGDTVPGMLWESAESCLHGKMQSPAGNLRGIYMFYSLSLRSISRKYL